MDHLSHTPPAAVPSKPSDWVHQLAYDIALEYHTPEELQLQYSLSPDEYDSLLRSPHVSRAINAYKKLVDEDASQAKLKVKRLASVLVEQVAGIALDKTNDPQVRLRAIEDICRYADLDKPNKQDDQQANASPFTINIQVNNS